MAEQANALNVEERKPQISWETEAYIAEGKPIRVVLWDYSEEIDEESGEPQGWFEADSFEVDPEKFPDSIYRRFVANAVERLSSGRVSQYSKEGNYFRFARIREDVHPLWMEGIWRPRKRSHKLEVQAVAKAFGLNYRDVAEAAKKDPEKFEKVLEKDEVQNALIELQQEETKPAQAVSLDTLL